MAANIKRTTTSVLLLQTALTRYHNQFTLTIHLIITHRARKLRGSVSEKGAHFSLNGENTRYSSKFIKQTMLRTAEECYQTSPQQQKTCFMVVPPIAAGDRKPKSFDVGRIWDKRSLGWRPVCVCRFYGHYEPITVLKTAKASKPATLKTVALCYRQIKNYSLCDGMIWVGETHADNK